MNKLSHQQITPNDKETVLPLVIAFYQSDAVDHPVPTKTLERTFQAVANPQEPSIQGYLLKENQEIIGFCYLTSFYCCEVGGTCVMIEEIYIKDQFQGKGYGTKTMELIQTLYPKAKRFRLEVTDANKGAIKLYEKQGYSFLSYKQMILDLE